MIVLIVILITAICIGILYGKMILIWRDSQLEKLEKIKKDLERIKKTS